MNNVSDYEKLSSSARLVIEEALKRGIKVDVLSSPENLICFQKENHLEYLKQGTLTSKENLMSYFLMGNKIITRYLLAENGLNVPFTKTYSNLEESLAAYPNLADRDWLIKYEENNHKEQILVKSQEELAFRASLTKAFTVGQKALLEEFIPGEEYRLFLVNQKCVAAIALNPARVIGDGKKSIRELITEKNKLRQSKIELNLDLISFLQQGNFTLDICPSPNEKVVLQNQADAEKGADYLNVMSSLPEEYKKISESASKIMKVQIAELRIIIRKLSLPAKSRNYAILGFNLNPDLSVYTHPDEGEGQNVSKAILDFLGF